MFPFQCKGDSMSCCRIIISVGNTSSSQIPRKTNQSSETTTETSVTVPSGWELPPFYEGLNCPVDAYLRQNLSKRVAGCRKLQDRSEIAYLPNTETTFRVTPSDLMAKRRSGCLSRLIRGMSFGSSNGRKMALRGGILARSKAAKMC